jgi:hypothetical protein
MQTYLSTAEIAEKWYYTRRVKLLDWHPKSDRNYKVHVLLNSTGDRYPSVPCSRMLLNQCT